MKTTLELNKALIVAAKALAVRRRITFDQVVETALAREVKMENAPSNKAVFELNADGFPILKRKKGKRVTSKLVYQLLHVS